jgi:hypothetical protein
MEFITAVKYFCSKAPEQKVDIFLYFSNKNLKLNYNLFSKVFLNSGIHQHYF